MPWSSTRTTKSRPAVRNRWVLRASAWACEALETRCLLAAGLSFAAGPTYTESGDAATWVPAVGNFNNDSYPDLVVAVTPSATGGFPNSSIKILLGSASGTFTLTHTIGLNFRTFWLTVADFNNDGYSDVVAQPDLQYTSQKSLFIFLGQGNGKIGLPSELVLPTPTNFPQIQNFVPAEVNGSGNNLDLVVAAYKAPIQIAQGNGNGTFTTGATVASTGNVLVRAADLDVDGKTDVVAFNFDDHTLDIYWGLGNAQFSARQTVATNYVNESDGFDLQLADLDNDGDADIVFTGRTSNSTPILLRSLRNDGHRSFTPVEEQPLNGEELVYVGDLDGDNLPDAVTGVVGGGMRVWGGRGNGFFLDTPVAFSNFPNGSCFADFDQDGKVDYVTPLYPQQGVQVFLNTYSLVTGKLFKDTNGNGVQDPTENPIVGVYVYADLDNNGARYSNEPAAFTNAQGIYRLSVAPGTARIRQVLTNGWYQTLPFGNSTPRVFGVNADQTVGGIDFGSTPLGSISGTAFYDFDQDGVIDPGDSGLSGFTVFIDLNANHLLDATDTQTITDGNGNFSFPGLIPKFYVVYIHLQDGWTQTYPTSPGFGAQGYHNVGVNGGFDAGGTNFGLIRPSFVSGRVFNDSNGDGVQGTGEAGIANWQLFIDTTPNGIDDPGEPFGTTDSSGNYQFMIGSSGTYTVRAVQRSGWNPTVPASAAHTFTVNTGGVATEQNFGFKQGALNNAGFLNPSNFSTGQFLNPVAIATGDFNRDGKQDFAAANNTGGVVIFTGAGNGTSFTASQPIYAGESVRAIIAIDLNGDGKLDLVTAAQDSNDASVLIGAGNGTFAAAVAYPAAAGASGVVAGDFNNDGKLDLAVSGRQGSQVALLRGNGNGTFLAATFHNVDFGGAAIAAGFFNADANLDLATVNGFSNTMSVLMGNGNGTFATFVNYTGLANAQSVATGDFNRDGRPDLAVVTQDNDSIVIEQNSGTGTFANVASYAAGSSPQHVAAADLDGDALLDLIVSFRSDGTTDISGGASILRGKGDGTFFAALTSTGHTSPTAAGIADFNGDARPDLALANFFSSDVSVLINNMLSPTATVTGAVYNDANNDGVKNTGEAAIANWRVFIDADNDGLFDSGELSALTDGSGNYTLSNIPAGTYSLRQVLQSGWALGAPGGGTYTINLAPGQTLGGRSFANLKTTFTAGSGVATSFTVRLNTAGDAIEVFQNTPTTSPPTQILPLLLNAGLSFVGSSAADSLTIDFTRGDCVPAGGIAFDGAGSAGGGNGIVFTGLGVLDVGTDLTFTGAPDLTVTGGAVTLPAGTVLGALSISGYGQVQVNYAPVGVLQVSSVSVAADARLDLGPNTLIIRATAATVQSAYAQAQAALLAGRDGGAWDGPGISTLAGPPNGINALGLATAGDVLGISGSATALWNGQMVNAYSILTKYTYGADANLDGKINVDDYGHIDFNVGLGNSGYFNGDFNYDGKINVDDYGIIDFNVGLQGPPLGSAAVASRASGDAVALATGPDIVACAAVDWGAFEKPDEAVIDLID